MKRMVILAACILLINTQLIMAGGGTQRSSSPEDFPNRPITLIITQAAGGGTDLGARLMIPFWERELGGTITPINQVGAGGWLAINELPSRPNDGYTVYAFSNGLATDRLNPSTNHPVTYNDVQLIGNYVLDISAWAKHVDDNRFRNLNELIEYARRNQVTVGCAAIGNYDWVVIQNVNRQLNTQFVAVPTPGGAAESMAALMGRHIDLLGVKVGEILTPVREGFFEPITVFWADRAPFFPDVPTFMETTGLPIFGHSARGHMMPKGGDPRVVQRLVDSYARAVNNPEFIAQLAERGLSVHYMDPDEYHQLMVDDERTVLEIYRLLGWL